VRSRSAAALLKGQGFDKAYSIEGGIDAWKGLKATGPYEAGMFLIEGRKTTGEYISLACSLEDGTGKFYGTVKDIIADEGSKKVFDSLVKAEERHKAALLEAYRKTKAVDIGNEGCREGALSGTMESGVSIEDAVAWVKQRGRETADILEFSMQIEANSLDFYMKVLREVEDEEARKAFRILMEEEKQHLSRLGNLINSMYNV
jgi:rubrerythrin